MNNNEFLLIIPSLKSVLNAQLNCFCRKVSVKVKSEKNKKNKEVQEKKPTGKSLSISACRKHTELQKQTCRSTYYALRIFALTFMHSVWLILIRPDGSLINGELAGNLLLLSVLSSIMTNSRTSCNFLWQLLPPDPRLGSSNSVLIFLLLICLNLECGWKGKCGGSSHSYVADRAAFKPGRGN